MPRKTVFLTLTEIKCVFLNVGPETPRCYCLGATQVATEHMSGTKEESKLILKYVKMRS